MRKLSQRTGILADILQALQVLRFASSRQDVRVRQEVRKIEEMEDHNTRALRPHDFHDFWVVKSQYLGSKKPNIPNGPGKTQQLQLHSTLHLEISRQRWKFHLLHWRWVGP